MWAERRARRMWTCDTCDGAILKGWLYVHFGYGRFHSWCMPLDKRETTTSTDG